MMEYIQTKWPDIEDYVNKKPCFFRKMELSLQSSCILLGNEVVVPHQKLLQELHEAHPGISVWQDSLYGGQD